MTDAATISLGLFVTMIVQTTGIAFWAGRVTQRLVAAEKTSGDSEKVTRLTVEMEHANASLDQLAHQMESVQRQLSNIATGRANVSGTL